jgi:hypothetical protein
VEIQFLVQLHQQEAEVALKEVMEHQQVLVNQVVQEAEVVLPIQAQQDLQKLQVQVILHQFLHLKEIMVVLVVDQEVQLLELAVVAVALEV